MEAFFSKHLAYPRYVARLWAFPDSTYKFGSWTNLRIVLSSKQW